VEVIRASTSSEQAIATTVAYAQAMRKTPIVVNDCPGFLVNRILFAYFGGFNKLISDGADFVAVDDIDKQEMVDRLMIPMCIEAARCLEDNIVGTASEVDMGLVYGVGFPPFRGGALHHIDKTGLAAFCQRADEFAHLGALYHPTDTMRQMAERGESFYNKQVSGGGERA